MVGVTCHILPMRFCESCKYWHMSWFGTLGLVWMKVLWLAPLAHVCVFLDELMEDIAKAFLVLVILVGSIHAIQAVIL